MSKSKRRARNIAAQAAGLPGARYLIALGFGPFRPEKRGHSTSSRREWFNNQKRDQESQLLTNWKAKLAAVLAAKKPVPVTQTWADMKPRYEAKRGIVTAS